MKRTTLLDLSSVAAWITILGLVSFTSHARADVPPEPGYVESCTVANNAQNGRRCRECSTYHGNPPTYCAEQAGAGFTKICQTRGASAWTEVWCALGDSHADTPAATPAATTSDEPATGEEAEDCSTAPVGSAAIPSVLMLAGWLFRRRRIAG